VGRRSRGRRALWWGPTGRTALPDEGPQPGAYGLSSHAPHDEPAVRSSINERADEGRIGVLLAISDFPLLVTGLRTVIDAQPDMRVVGTAESPEALRDRLETDGADVVIAECQPGNRTGCATYASIESMKAARPGLRVLVMECRCGSEQFSLALKAGADGFLTREAVDTDVVSAVRCVQRGQTYVSPAIVTRMVNTYVLRSPSEALNDPYESLSDRDKEVLLLAATGYTNREIARTLHLSEQTVHNYRATIMEKLALHDRVELLKFAVRRGLIEVADL
jgi:two-component system, NarL family, response regulator NreC